MWQDMQIECTIRSLRAGKRVSRPRYLENGIYFYLNSEGIIIEVHSKMLGVEYIWEPSQEDVLASDWCLLGKIYGNWPTDF